MTNENQSEAITSAPAQVPPAAPPPTEEAAIKLPTGPGAPVTDAAQSVPLAPPEDDAPPPWLGTVDWILLTLAVALGFVLASVPATNADLWMYLATGRLIAHGDYAPGGPDPFSYATVAHDGTEATRWVNHSWLFSLALYGLYTAFGPVGVIAAKGILVALLAIVLMQIRSRDTNKFIVAVFLTLTVLALSARLGPLQPALLSYLFLGILLFMLFRSGALGVGGLPEADPPARAERWLWSLPVLFIVWVNVDHWFILGLLALGLCCVGLAVQRWRRMAAPVCLGRFGAIFAVSIVACLVNPSHVWAFQLPPDLAYLLLRAANAAGVELPESFFGGGQALAVLQGGEAESLVARLTLSPLNKEYITEPYFGYNIAGLCFFALIAFGLLSFAANGMVSGKPGAPAPNAARFLIWLLFAVLAVLSFRFIGFFAIVAGPIAALNFGELAAWYTAPLAPGSEPTPWVAPARLVRLLSVPLLLVLIGFAWPGWINGKMDFELSELMAPRHVAWEMPVDPSLQLAAERLEKIQSNRTAGQPPVRVFSTGFDLGCYCAWFAPGVRTFIDYRLSVFGSSAGEFMQIKRALQDRQKRPRNDKEWIDALRRHGITHVAVENFVDAGGEFIVWWRDAMRWKQEFADSRVAVFAWSGEQRRWPSDATIAEWNRQAFGVVPVAERPAAKGPPPPADEQQGWLDRYLKAPPRIPQSALDMELKRNYANFASFRAMELARPLASYPMFGPPLVPGSFVTPYVWMAGTPGVSKYFAVSQEPQLRNFPFWGPVDAAPPAVPVLIVRDAWKTVAAAPDYERSHSFLAHAIKFSRDQEDYWVATRIRSQPPFTVRSQLRGVQFLASLRTAVDVGITSSDRQFVVHQQLAERYFEKHALDLAVEEMTEAVKAVDAMMAESPRKEEELRKTRKVLEEQRTGVEKFVQKRKDHFAATTLGKKPMDKVAELVGGRPRTVDKENKQQLDPKGWGLTGLTIETLLAIDPRSLSEAEYRQWAPITIDMLFQNGFSRKGTEILFKALDKAGGQAKLAPENLEFIKGLVPYLVLAAGTQGNYDEMQAQLNSWAMILGGRVGGSFITACSVGLMAPPPALGYSTVALGTRVPRQLAPGQFAAMNFNDLLDSCGNSFNDYYNLRTLRGVLALESGQTGLAYTIFDDVLREAGSFFFLERPIAERYHAMLAQYHKK
jgi:hypothetical protein